MTKLAAILLTALLLAGGVGCADDAARAEAKSGVRAHLAGNYERAIRKLEPLAEEPDRDYALNNLRLGMAGLAAGDLDVAERGFFTAYEVINAGRVNKGGREAAAVWISEDIRIWKGEPYERAIANLHLGFVYYQRGDYENARGAFENALFKLRDYKDADAERFEDVESSFAAALVMLGRTWVKLGRDDLAEQQFRVVRDRVPELAALADVGLHRETNVLLVVGVGRGPVKVEADNGGVGFRAAGTRRRVGYGPGGLGYAEELYDSATVPPVGVTVDGRPVRVRGALPAYDALAMSRQRRWQRIDTIRATKSVAGDALVLGGGLTLGGADNRDNAAAGAGMILAGLLLKASSKPDLRVWETAPRAVYLLPMDLPPGRREVTVTVPGQGEATAVLDVPQRGEAMRYLLPGRVYRGPVYEPDTDFERPPVTIIE